MRKPVLLAAVLLAALTGRAAAQVAPTSGELAQYRGLLAAAANGDVVEIKRFIDAGGDPDMRDSHGRTPLHVAAFRKNRDAITALVRAGADINATENDRYDAVTIASVADDVGTLRMLLQLGASARQVTSRYDGTALIAAAHLGHDLVVRMLIDAGAPLDHVNNLARAGEIPPLCGDGADTREGRREVILQLSWQ